MRRKPPLINKQTTGGSLVADIDDLDDVAITSAAGDDLLQFNGTNWVNVTEVSDGNVPETAVTQHEAALSITESQITDLSHTVEVNDLTTAVTWADVPDANITESSVTQHEAALTITEAQISDLTHYTDTDANAAIDARVDQAFVEALSVDHGSLTGLADNDHPQYARIATNETITGAWDFLNDGSFVDLTSTSYRDSPTTHVRLVGRAARGTAASPSALQTGDEIMSLAPFPHNGTSFQANTEYRWRAIWNAGASTVSWETDSDVNLGGALTATSYGGIASANLLDKTATEEISGNWTFSASLQLDGNAPYIRFLEEDAATDEQMWLWGTNSKTFELVTRTGSSGIGGGGESPLRFIRGTGTTVDEIELNATLLDFNGAADFSSTLRAADGSAGAPAYSFSGDTDTGMYLHNTGQLGFSSQGSVNLRVRSGDLLSNVPVYINEQASANADLSGWGQIWVLNETPNRLVFTDDTGTDHFLGDSRLELPERSAFSTANAGFGSIWVDTATPNRLFFTDDAGNEHHVAGGQLTENRGVVKSADETVNNSATLQDDNDLTLSVVSGFTYLIKVYLRVEAASTTPDFRVKVDSPSGGTEGFWTIQQISEANNNFIFNSAQSGWTFQESGLSIGSSNAEHFIIQGVITPQNNGDVTVQWAQSTAHASDTTVKKYSSLTLQRV